MPNEGRFHIGAIRIRSVAIAVVAHILAWMWRPWLPGPGGYKTAMDSIQHIATASMSYLT
ncbi:MAG: light-harvesting protein [Hyphomicrobiales bacterium]|nr:light-harvesting protein [Hyphomicrobiales bacterium]